MMQNGIVERSISLKPVRNTLNWSGHMLASVTLVLLITVVGTLPLMAQTQQLDSPGIWGKIDHYSHDYAMVDGKRYEFTKITTIDTYSLKPDKRGNVRIVLDERGRVARLYFYGIDMPDVVKQFRRN